MKILKQFFNHCFIFSVKKFSDKRGYFSEIFNKLVIKNNFKKKFKCKQVNFVYSKRNSLRGIHLQKKPKSQIKINAFYDRYVGRQLLEIDELRKETELKLHERVDFEKCPGLSNEIKEILRKNKPKSIGEARQLTGMTPAAASILLRFVKK